MARAIMGGDFRAIRTAPVAEPVADLRLALVDLFAQRQAEPPADVPQQDAQEPAEQPQTDASADGPVEPQTPADEAPADAEPVVEPAAPESEAKADDYDPIAAVLG